jgi:hypothetical protein
MKEDSTIQGKIFRWLSEEHLNIVEVLDTEAKFHIVIKYPDEENDMHILQPLSRKDAIIILSGAFVESEQIYQMEKIDFHEREDFISKLREKLNNFPSDFYLEQKDGILNQFVITYQIFHDGLTKDHLFRGMGLVLKAKLHGIWEIQRKFGRID